MLWHNRTRKLSFVYRGQPERHISASRCKHHILWIELDTLNRPGMIGVKNTHLVPSICVPHVDPAVSRSAEYELRIGTERSFDRYTFIIEVSGEGLQWRAVECIDQPYDGAVRADQNGFTVAGKFQACPIAFFFLCEFERYEGTL